MRIILLVSVLLIFIAGFSQTRHFTYLASEDGISQSEVYSFLKDSRGFVWFGTVDGLNRYNGYEIEVFNTKRNDPNSLSNNTIKSLTEDSLGRIWIGTGDGLNVYDPETELFHPISISTLKNDRLIVWSLIIHDGHLIIGTSSGLWMSNIQTTNLKDIKSGFRQVRKLQNENNIRSIIPSARGGIWLLQNGSASRIEFPVSNNEPKLLEKFSFGELMPAIAIVEDLSGNLWIAFTKDGILRYNPKTRLTRHFTKYGTSYGPASRKCAALALDKDGNLWIGTRDKGLNFIQMDELHKEEVIFETIQVNSFNSSGITSNLIYSLYISEDNLLWIGTIGSGVNIYNPNQKKFKHYKFPDLTGDSPKSNFIRSVYADDQNRILAGTHGDGLFVFHREKNKLQKLGFETQTIFHIANYRENKYLICSGTGIYLVEIINNKLRIIDRLEMVLN